MTIYEHASAHLIDCGMTETQAEKFLLVFGSGQGKDVEWGGIAPFLSRALCDRIDFAAGRWMNNPANREQPAPVTVREWKAKRDGKLLAAHDDEPEPPRAA